jgi:hypothetical protein
MDLTTIIILAVCAILAAIGVPVSIKTGLININFRKPPTDFFRITNLVEKYVRDIEKASNNILKNQMMFAEATIQEINCHLENNGEIDRNEAAFVYDIIKNVIKSHFISNGLNDMDGVAFSQYVGTRIDLIRNKYKELVKSDYIDSHTFSDSVAEIYNHARSCSDYWKCKIKDLETKKNEEIEDIIKEYKNGN